MSARRLLLPLLLLLLLPSVAAYAQTAPAGVTIRLVEKKKLRLVRYTAGRKDPGAVGLEGALAITLANGDRVKTVRLPKHDVHGLVFRPKAGGAPFVVIHSCQCAHDAASRKYEGFTLLPGWKHSFTVADWGCDGGMWAAPPPGSYQVQYRSRLLPEPKDFVPPPARTDPVNVLIEECRKRLLSDDYWKNAVVSNAVEVTLREPVTVRLGTLKSGGGSTGKGAAHATVPAP